MFFIIPKLSGRMYHVSYIILYALIVFPKLAYKKNYENSTFVRFNGQDFLERFRGKSIMFVGDSLSRNQWQSLTCMLVSDVPNAKYNLTREGDVSIFAFTVWISITIFFFFFFAVFIYLLSLAVAIFGLI